MSDAFSQSVTAWIDDLKQGQDLATKRLWDRYFQRLVMLANRKLGAASRRVSDEEDVAIDVFHALCEGAAAGRFEKLKNRDDLWSLLVAITSKKSVDQIRRQTSKKRGAGDVRGNSIFAAGDRVADGGFEQVVADAPSPEFLVQIDEEHNRLLEILPEDSQRQIATYRLAGYSNEEIAQQVGISLRSVERKLQVIRDAWSQELQL